MPFVATDLTKHAYDLSSDAEPCEGIHRTEISGENNTRTFFWHPPRFSYSKGYHNKPKEKQYTFYLDLLLLLIMNQSWLSSEDLVIIWVSRTIS